MQRLINPDAISDTGIHYSTGALLDVFIASNLHKKYEHWFINIETVIRNFIDNMNGDAADKIKFLKRKDFTKMIDELVSDISIMYDQISDDFNLVFYKIDYSKLSDSYGNFKQDDDFKGLKYYVYLYQDIIIKKLKEHIDIIFIKHDKLPHLNKTLITTHIPVDLFNFKNVKDIMLFESFTGELKPESKWYTKYKPLKDKDMSVIPFVEVLYVIFGDNWRIKALPIKTRLNIYDIAIKKKWNYKTSKVKVFNDIKSIDRILFESIKMIKQVYK
jgi:hypothetical protein